MKLAHWIIVTTIAAASSAFAATSHDHQPLHGGVVAEVKDMDLEFVAKPGVLQLHIRQDGKTVDVSKASAKVSLLVGTDKQDVELKPAGDKFEATGNFKISSGAKAVAVVNLPGKAAITARFAVK